MVAVPPKHDQTFKLRPLVISSEGVSGYVCDQGHSTAMAAKNIQENGQIHYQLLSNCTYNTHTLKKGS